MAKIEAMSPEEVAKSVAWMRDAEIKHARLAMLAAAGWVHAELYSPFQLAMSNGRAPSLFNGHLLDFLPFIFVALAPIAYLEFQNKDRLLEGDYSFDPLGCDRAQMAAGCVAPPP